MKILITEQQYKSLSEGKDYVYGTYNGKTIEASNEDWEAIPFVYYNNKVYVGYTPDLGYEYKEDGYVDSAGDNDYPNYHSEIMDFYKFVYRNDPNYELELPQRRNTYEYLGRIWVESEIISFWKYPQDVNILKKILTLLAKEVKTIYDFDIDFENYIVDLNLEPDNNNFISLKDYVKGNDATEDELEQPHLLPSKEKRETPQMQAVRDYDSQMKAEKFKNVPEYQWNFEKTKGIAENKKRNIVITEQQLTNLINNTENNINDNFWRWFNNSKIVDKTGNPRILYHGTKSTDSFNEFSYTKDIGYHFSASKNVAKDMSGYNQPSDEWTPKERIKPIEVYLSIKNPAGINDLEFWRKNDLIRSVEKENKYRLEENKPPMEFQYDPSLSLIDNMKKYAFELSEMNGNYNDIDGFVYYNEFEGRFTNDSKFSFIALKPNQIKSIDNDGSWDINDNNILS